MSKHVQEFDLKASGAQVLEMCQEVAVRMGWRVLAISSSTMTLKEVSSQVTSFTLPARIDVSISTTADDSCHITLNGSISGIGPIQRNHLQGQMGRFLNDLSLSIDRSRSNAKTESTATTSASLSDEISRLKTLLDEGVLSAEEFAAAKARLLR